MDTAIELWSTLSNSLFLVSGGRTNPSISKTEGEAMRDYATAPLPPKIPSDVPGVMLFMYVLENR